MDTSDPKNNSDASNNGIVAKPPSTDPMAVSPDTTFESPMDTTEIKPIMPIAHNESTEKSPEPKPQPDITDNMHNTAAQTVVNDSKLFQSLDGSTEAKQQNSFNNYKNDSEIPKPTVFNVDPPALPTDPNHLIQDNPNEQPQINKN